MDLSSAFGEHYKDVLRAAAHQPARGHVEQLQLMNVEMAQEERLVRRRATIYNPIHDINIYIYDNMIYVYNYICMYIYTIVITARVYVFVLFGTRGTAPARGEEKTPEGPAATSRAAARGVGGSNVENLDENCGFLWKMS